MKPLKWKLVEVWSSYGRALDNMHSWLRSQGKIIYPAIARIKKHPESAIALENLYKQDKQSNGVSKQRQGWRRAAGTTLLALQWLYRGKVLELNAAGVLSECQTWQMLNCQPSGGQWVADRFEEGFTGTRCQSPLCPWCYLRGFNAHTERISLMCAPGKKLRETTISLYKICPSPVTAVEDVNHNLIRYVSHSIRRKLNTPAYRLMGYPCVMVNNKIESYNVCVGYFTSEALDWGNFCKKIKVKNEVHKVYFENVSAVWIDHGVRHVWQYPAGLLGASCETIVSYLKFRKRRRDYGVVRPFKQDGVLS